MMSCCWWVEKDHEGAYVAGAWCWWVAKLWSKHGRKIVVVVADCWTVRRYGGKRIGTGVLKLEVACVDWSQ